MYRNAGDEDVPLSLIDAETRKCGYQKGLETLVVRTVNLDY